MIIDERSALELAEAVQCQDPVEGLTHKFYRYPARFSPQFARKVIEVFTHEGDIVFDPFMGGGTTLVEAAALGRVPVGSDINSLAVFVSRVKTSWLSEHDLMAIGYWASGLPQKTSLRKPTPFNDWKKMGYHRNISCKNTWRIRKLVELALESITELESTQQQEFARCALLRTAQWALDCKDDLPTVKQFRQQLTQNIAEMTVGARDFAACYRQNRIKNTIGAAVCLHRSAIGIEEEPAIASLPHPKLILTSPPYPGFHVLYHRWQVQGRRETPAPYWIANCLDGNGESFYTLGNRKEAELKTYYSQLHSAFSSIAKVAGQQTIIVQMVAFSDPSWQLERYLEIMDKCGLVEILFHTLPVDTPDGRLWRTIPNRKWYANKIPNTEEVVLFHKLRTETY